MLLLRPASLIGLLLLTFLMLPASVLALEPPTGRVLLKVGGEIGVTNVGDEAHFDREMLLALPQRQTLTATPWHDGTVAFSGPLGRELLAAVGAHGETLRVVALNDYEVNLPVADLQRYDVILAMTKNGEPLRVRDQGPLFVIYPFDEAPHLLNEEILSRSVWQVARLHVLGD
ncbi:molybdopterin-dependent oxidoreductase [Halomonas mongoliensis]|uniref:Molybdopterin-dependent oxidoreductase n=1 Tax=Halomonas mongoliensis TaxID=321265 RepID=A0ABU1GHN9_9GAMM|nr:molybdopterin-dependent oxidoreductase [Halomonas mongoliensis]MDR5891529.1 molybdopterin-dependent oxidoreductase [Halomonas mongoliensis]